MKHLLILCILLCTTLILTAANPLMIEASEPMGLSLRFVSPELRIAPASDSDFHLLSMEHATHGAEPGSPDLPIFGGFVILPPNGSYSLDVQLKGEKSHGAIRPMPIEDESDAKRGFDPDRYYNAEQRAVVSAGEISTLRDFRVLPLQINPAQWDPQSLQLRSYDEIEISIRFTDEKTDTDMGAYSSYSPAFRKLYEARLLNFNDYRDLNQSHDYGRILMIYNSGVNAAYVQMLEAFGRWKRMKGHELTMVSTQTTGTSNGSIRTYIQNQYDNPVTRPDYIILVGDTPQIPTYYENLSGYNGEGDYPYTFLAGNDMLGDAFIGRISVETVEQLATVLEKIYRYERDLTVDPDFAGWLDRMLLVGDPSVSGISCMYNSKYIKELAEMANPNYSFVEHYSSSAANTINSAINQGTSFFSYRGYIGMSGWSPSASLMNGPRLPHAVILTCSTGNFAGSYSPGTSESFIRLGTSASPAGAVTAIGMATSATHTMFNNALNAAIFNGIFTYEMRSMGEALLNGRLFLKEVYESLYSNHADYFAHWCNLMGDPSMEVFIGIPDVLNISAVDELPRGSRSLDLSITNASGNPVSQVSVTAYSPAADEIVARGFTDENGALSLQIGSGIQSQLIITAAKNDHKPSSHTVAAGDGGIVLYDKLIYDSGEQGSIGNGDGYAQAGETVAVMITVKNTSDEALTGLSGSVVLEDEHASLLTSSISFDDIPSGGHLTADAPVLFSISHSVPAIYDLRLDLSVNDSSDNNHSFPVHIALYNGELSVDSFSIQAGGDGILDPTETGTLQLNIKNSSVATVHGISAQLISLNDLVQVIDDQAFVGSIVSGQTTVAMESFTVLARSLAIPGMQIPFRARLTNDDGFLQDAFFNVSIGTVGQNTPLGPDSYGYFIYDQTDTTFSDCPVYDWIEINPSLGGDGTQITGYYDPGSSNEEGDILGSVSLKVVDLPFSFPFYGIDYDEITVCSNGFIAFGVTENAEFRNSRLPGGMGPSPMIAAFWDDLIFAGDAGIYQYYDAENGWFIVEYSRMRSGYDRNSLETFQVIFYDPAVHPTGMGDGKIKIQYKDFNNIAVGGGGYTPVHGHYATIGIKDHTNTRGLEYTFNNIYPDAAAPLSHHSAILITTVPVLHESPYLLFQDLVITDPNGNNIAEAGETIELGFRLINQGLNPAENTHISVSMNHPHAQLMNSQSAYPHIASDAGAVNIQPIGVSISPDCPDGSLIQLTVNVMEGASEWSYPASFTVRRPAVSIKNYFVDDSMGNGNGLVEPGEDIRLAVNFINSTAVKAKEISANIMSVSPYVNITSSYENIPMINPGEIAQVIFEISILETAPLGYNITFYVSYLGDMIDAQSDQMMLSVGTTGMSNDFESNDGYFQPSPSVNGWEWGSSAWAGAHSGEKVWGTRLNAFYNAVATYHLTTQPVYIGADFMLEFWHKYHIDENDGGQVKISTDGGSSWQLLTPDGGYPSSNISALNGPGFTGVCDEWTRVIFPLSEYGSQNVQFRFTFSSGVYEQNEGWFIDDIRTSGYVTHAGVLTGNVSTTYPWAQNANARVKNQDGIFVPVDAQGDYLMLLPMGSHLVSAVADGYQSQYPVNVLLSNDGAHSELDFFLGYLSPVTDITHNLEAGVLTLTWQNPELADYLVQYYEVYRRFGASAFEMMALKHKPNYSEELHYDGVYQYYVIAIYPEGRSIPGQILEINAQNVSIEDPDTSPMLTGIGGNYPNPFNPETTILFSLAEASSCKISIFNVKGQKVRELLMEDLPAGEHRRIWDGKDDQDRLVSSGIYFIHLQAGKSRFTKKAMLMK